MVRVIIWHPYVIVNKPQRKKLPRKFAGENEG